MTDLNLNLPIQGQPGDSFRFTSPGSNTQYRFEITPAFPDALIGVWPGRRVPGRPGVARNKPGQGYVDRTLPAGPYEITVETEGPNRTSTPAPGPFILTVKARSWWRKVFGW